MLSQLRLLQQRRQTQIDDRQAYDFQAIGNVATLSESLIPRALSMLRWGILVSTLAVTLAWSFDTRVHYPVWILVIGFIGYNLIAEMLRRKTQVFGSFAAIALLDLPFAVLAYCLDEAPGGPLFIIFFLGIISAGMSMTTRNASIYVGITVAVFAIIGIMFPGWSLSESELRQLGSRLIVLLSVSVGTILVRRQLLLERRHAIRLSELDRRRTEFIESLSHDLKTPFTSIRAGLGMLAEQTEGRLEINEQSLLNNVRRNVDRLGIQIENLLLLNQIDSGTLQPDMELLDLRGPVNAAVSTVRLLIKEKRQELTMSLPTPLPVYGDPAMLEQLIVNLLVNAHRHTPAGTLITIAGTIHHAGIALRVSDTGPGISAADQKHIFKRHYRRGKVGGGSGLGLAIVEAFATFHHGQVVVESQLGYGTAFVVTIPVAGADIDL